MGQKSRENWTATTQACERDIVPVCIGRNTLALGPRSETRYGGQRLLLDAQVLNSAAAEGGPLECRVTAHCLDSISAAGSLLVPARFNLGSEVQRNGCHRSQHHLVVAACECQDLGLSFRLYAVGEVGKQHRV